MNATAEIDKSGRIVVPKKLRDALHLVPGTRLTLRQDGAALIVETENKPKGLYFKDGILVYDAGCFPALKDRDWVQENRDARAEELLGGNRAL